MRNKAKKKPEERFKRKILRHDALELDADILAFKSKINRLRSEEQFRQRQPEYIM